MFPSAEYAATARMIYVAGAPRERFSTYIYTDMYTEYICVYMRTLTSVKEAGKARRPPLPANAFLSTSIQMYIQYSYL